jgi:hypothetical protein
MTSGRSLRLFFAEKSGMVEKLVNIRNDSASLCFNKKYFNQKTRGTGTAISQQTKSFLGDGIRKGLFAVSLYHKKRHRLGYKFRIQLSIIEQRGKKPLYYEFISRQWHYPTKKWFR